MAKHGTCYYCDTAMSFIQSNQLNIKIKRHARMQWGGGGGGGGGQGVRTPSGQSNP